MLRDWGSQLTPCRPRGFPGTKSAPQRRVYKSCWRKRHDTTIGEYMGKLTNISWPSHIIFEAFMTTYVGLDGPQANINSKILLL